MTAEEIRAVNGKSRFLDDRHGKRSSMRPTSLPALAAAFVFGLLTLLCPRTDDEKGLYLSAFFLIAAFAPKAIQKFAEAEFQ